MLNKVLTLFLLFLICSNFSNKFYSKELKKEDLLDLDEKRYDFYSRILKETDNKIIELNISENDEISLNFVKDYKAFFPFLLSPKEYIISGCKD